MYQSYGFQNFKLKLALSTMEAEYIDLSQSIRDLIPVRELIREFISWSSRKSYFKMFWSFQRIYWSSQKQYSSSVVYEENGACLQFAKMPNLSPCTKHIGLSYNWFRSKVSSLETDIQAVSSTNLLADQFTKGLFQENLWEWYGKI